MMYNCNDTNHQCQREIQIQILTIENIISENGVAISKLALVPADSVQINQALSSFHPETDSMFFVVFFFFFGSAKLINTNKQGYKQTLSRQVSHCLPPK